MRVPVAAAVRERGDPWGEDDPAPDPRRFYGAVFSEDAPPEQARMRPYAVPDGQLAQPADGQPAQSASCQPAGGPLDGVEYAEADILWFPVPPDLMDYVAVGAVHTRGQCPLWVVRVLDDDENGEFEILASSEGLLDFARCLTENVTSIACFAAHLHGPQPLRGPVGQPHGTRRRQ